MPEKRMPAFYEFFAGGGMARAGLGSAWNCLFANDFDAKKVASYQSNWGAGDILWRDVAQVDTADLPGSPDLIWASSPCQDFSLAGKGMGLGASADEARTRSGSFWPFWALITRLKEEGRSPKAVVLENVPGLLTSKGGADFADVCSTICASGYRLGTVQIDAKLFLPQSRARIFIIAVRNDIEIPSTLIADEASSAFTSKAVKAAFASLDQSVRKDWIYWSLPHPKGQSVPLAEIIEDQPSDVAWHSEKQTSALLASMTALHQHKVEMARRTKGRTVGTLYRRTRPTTDGGRAVRAEVRFDDVAGCLRTPSGGSSRQKILVVENGRVRSRLLSGREAARLMGLPDTYVLPARYNDAYHLAGDGVAVPVVRHIAEHLLEPLLVRGTPSVLIAA
jgi:DNA (cytosine-5)-methyltransferase 1